MLPERRHAYIHPAPALRLSYDRSWRPAPRDRPNTDANAAKPMSARSASGIAILLLCLGTSAPAYSQGAPKDAVAFANSALAKLYSVPNHSGDHCSLGARISANCYVTRLTAAESLLVRGDRVVSLNGRQCESGSYNILRSLASVPPDATVDVMLSRDGQTRKVAIECTNGKPEVVLLERVLSAVSSQRWRECMVATRDLAALSGPSAFSSQWYFSCANFARELSGTDQAVAAYERDRLSIEEDRWDPIAWPTRKAALLAEVSVFERQGYARLGADLQKQIDAVDSGRSVAASAPPPNAGISRSTGTGFVVDQKGTVVTSNHVVEGAHKIAVRCGGNKVMEAKVTASSRMTDLAVLETDPATTAYLPLASARSTTSGTPVFTFGYPIADLLGGEPKFTDGAVSSMSGIGGEQTFMQISIPIQPGNSGGPVVNDDGQVVGVVAAAAAIEPFFRNTGTLPQNVNWAVKAEYAAVMFDAPPSLPRTTSRQAAIERTRKAVCYIEAE